MHYCFPAVTPIGVRQNVNVCSCNITRVSFIISLYWPTLVISFTPDCFRSMFRLMAETGWTDETWALALKVAADDTSRPKP